MPTRDNSGIGNSVLISAPLAHAIGHGDTVDSSATIVGATGEVHLLTGMIKNWVGVVVLATPRRAMPAQGKPLKQSGAPVDMLQGQPTPVVRQIVVRFIISITDQHVVAMWSNLKVAITLPAVG